jgi:hypothetical protein
LAGDRCLTLQALPEDEPEDFAVPARNASRSCVGEIQTVVTLNTETQQQARFNG